ncbi:alcohol dehydrogenase catalytic domain-containing protein [Vibrio sp. Isolate32]|uniref:alcohol dehydrogenase catalytic domain-containing protein n=1 Tax=Vibrio sp. Isolate32 TaxID=2908538 RepID=UPI001EFCDDD8|nr:alcohol dehydrogenase catalytic domain-containing protein [Vibrio sp. Isolate32]MCG9554329.1 alcohol dehydrogenase catalytic domain-containing protein [Vibrio sp. Isolate32]
MKALVYTKKNEMTYRDEPTPDYRIGHVVVDIEAAGICGSDMHAYHGHDPRRVPPLILGHEACGIATQGIFKGKRVVINPLITCGHCPSCQIGKQNLCIERTAIGLSQPGALAQSTLVPQQNLIKVPEGMTSVHAALAEPAATALHSVALAEKLSSRSLSEGRALIIGAGSIGLLIALFLKSKGCQEIVISDTNDLRLKTASKTRVCKTHNPSTDNTIDSNTFDLVIDAVGAGITRNTAIDAVLPGGVIVHVGLQDSVGEFDMRKLTLFEITLVGSFSYTQIDMIAAVHALNSGALGDLSWVEVRDLSEGAQAFKDLDQGKTSAAKIVLKCQ